MELLQEKAGIRYGCFQSADLDQMCAVLGESFGRGEPMAVAVGLSDIEIRDIVALFGSKAAREQLTVVAGTADGSLVGALLTQDFATPPPQGLDLVAEAFHPIGKLLDGLDDEYRKSREIRSGEFLHLFMIGVLPALTGMKIAQNLLAVCLKNGVSKGYRAAVTEATGRVSQHIFRQAGFVDRCCARYAEFVFAEKHVFSSISAPPAAVLMDKELV